MYYDKNGSQISIEEWATKLEDADYRQVGFWENDKLWVSTVFLGIDHNLENDEIHIFETKVFSAGSFKEIDVERYSTEEEAKAGHKRMVEKYSNSNGGGD